MTIFPHHDRISPPKTLTFPPESFRIRTFKLCIFQWSHCQLSPSANTESLSTQHYTLHFSRGSDRPQSLPIYLIHLNPLNLKPYRTVCAYQTYHTCDKIILQILKHPCTILRYILVLTTCSSTLLEHPLNYEF
jgi:hypothetical protein